MIEENHIYFLKIVENYLEIRLAYDPKKGTICFMGEFTYRTLAILDKYKFETSKQYVSDLIKEDLKQVEGDAYKTQAKIKELESNVLSLEKDLEKIYEQNKLYEEYQSALEFNDKIDDKVETLETALNKSKSFG